MSFNLFGPTEKRDIKVGYISTDRGYVKGISLYEANKYAFKNPGTTFILETRDSTRYLNINDVNNLTVEDIIPKKTAADGTCPGVVGLNPQVSPNDTIGTGGPGNTIDPRSVLPRGPLGPISPEEPVGNGATSSQPTGSQNTQTNVPDGSPLVVISGCGGVGAKAIPVIGNDGGILDIVVTSGGFGYKCPPQVTVIDPNRVGSGVVATSTIGVTTSPSLLTYTDEDDFEVYNFDPANGSPDLPGYGNRVNPDGENVGEWDPTLFATFAKDPIALEIAKYQKFLKQLKNPWWTTRKETPLNVSFGDRRSKVTHNVTHPAWEKEFMNKHAISPVPPSNVKGSDFAGRWCTFEWEENFPHAGEYIFRGMADNIGKMYLDNEIIMEVTDFKGSSKVVKKTVEEGVHRIKVDLLNVPIREKPKTKLKSGGCPTEIDFKITTDAKFANGIRIPGLDIDFSKKYDGKQLNESFKRKVELGKEYNVICTSNRKSKSSNKDYPITYEDLNPSNESIRVVKNGKKIELKDGKGNDANVEFEILAPSPGVTAKFSNDGRELIVNGDGDVPIQIKYDDNPGYAGEAVRSITIAGTTWRKERTEYGEEIKTIKVKSGDGGKRANVKLRTAGETVVQMEDFKDNDYTDIIISASKGKFYDLNGNKCKFVVGAPVKDINRVQDGVSYNGPQLFVIKSGSAVKFWSKYMQTSAVSPFIPPIDKDNPEILGVKTFTWSNVDFIESGRYKFLFQSDDDAILYINGNKILESKSFRGEPIPSFAEISKGKYEVKVVCNNITLPKNILIGNNPTGFALKIVKDVVISETSFPWTTNPVGISAILIPPPCPKVVDGKGIVVDIDVKSPGNGFPAVSQGGVPTVVTIKDIEPTLPGINYDPDDKAIINDTPVPIEVDNFGRVTSIKPSAPIIVTDTPVIEIPSLTGAGFRGTPIMQTTIVPDLVFDDADIIQVTDLVGLKQNGYVNGKPYYGSVFSKNGELFAGIVETTGVLVPVYATLQESIDNRVTTRPSAILRQGTDTNSNNPRLNIPGTPQNLI